MNNINLVQVILLTILAALKAYDYHCTQVCIFNSVFWGAMAGLIMGDLQTGLYVGGTMQLMSLGVVGIGGACGPGFPPAAAIAPPPSGFFPARRGIGGYRGV